MFRLVFYFTLCSLFTSALETGLTEQEIKDIVDEHNKDRSIDASAGPEAASDMIKMEWSENLAKMAQAYADKCIYEHSDKPKLGIGENLFITTANLPKKGLAMPVTYWYDEKQNYDSATGKCEAGKVCGHYKQVVWSGASKVGCGLKKCDTMEGTSWENVYYVVCNYNRVVLKGKKPYIEAESCTHCPPEYQTCSPYKTKNLCLFEPK